MWLRAGKRSIINSRTLAKTGCVERVPDVL
jgi:hypothetical protein